MAGPRKGTTGLRRLLNAARHSLDGFSAALSEAAFRQELVFAAVLVPLGLFLGATGIKRALLVGSAAVMLALVNAAAVWLFVLAT